MAYQHYIAVTDVKDVVLAPHVTTEYLEQLERYIQNLAKVLEVDIAKVPKPLTTFALDLAVAFVCLSIARDKSGVNPQQAGNGVELDVYMVKEKMWRKEFERLEGMVSAPVLTNGTVTRGSFAHSVMIWRT